MDGSLSAPWPADSDGKSMAPRSASRHRHEHRPRHDRTRSNLRFPPRRARGMRGSPCGSRRGLCIHQEARGHCSGAADRLSGCWVLRHATAGRALVHSGPGLYEGDHVLDRCLPWATVHREAAPPGGREHTGGRGCGGGSWRAESRHSRGSPSIRRVSPSRGARSVQAPRGARVAGIGVQRRMRASRPGCGRAPQSEHARCRSDHGQPTSLLPASRLPPAGHPHWSLGALP